MVLDITEGKIKKIIAHNFKTIRIRLKLLEFLQDMLSLKDDIDSDTFERKVMEHLGNDDFIYIKDIFQCSRR